MRRLTFPVTETWDWQLSAACRGMDSEVFFHPEGERGPSKVQRESKAKRVCRVCPVARQCLDHALSVQEPYGVWGGLSTEERHAELESRTVALPFPRRRATVPRVVWHPHPRGDGPAAS